MLYMPSFRTRIDLGRGQAGGPTARGASSGNLPFVQFPGASSGNLHHANTVWCTLPSKIYADRVYYLSRLIITI